MQFTLSPETEEACEPAVYNEWVATTGFSSTAYSAAMGALTTSPDYWNLMSNGTLLTEFMEHTALGDLGTYYETYNQSVERYVSDYY